MFSKIVAFYILSLVALLASAVIVEPEKRDLGDIINTIVDGGKSIFSDVKTVVESVGGEAKTIVTAAGGEAITLAADGAGVVTSFAGSVYTAATGEATSLKGIGNAALGMNALYVSTPLVGGLLTVLASIVAGAWVAL
ncbi:hypothetical protein C8Q74DRAFT_1364382 [Fomes fomentarius]|nr:hypothetical protein C8Q74DRAFT_1364382 [Fomes fomentarius]